MGHAAIIYAAVAVGIALACLLIGRVWGRSNVKSQVEDAVEAARKSADAREYSLREQLEVKIAEVARLTPLAEELVRLKPQLKREMSDAARAAVGTNNAPTSAGASGEVEPISEIEEPAPPVESADEAIQKLLQSLEANLHEPVLQQDPQPHAPVPEPAKPEPVVQRAPESRPAIESLPSAPRTPVPSPPPPRPVAAPKQPTARPVPPAQPAAAPRPIAPPAQPLPRPVAQPRPAPAQPTAAQPPQRPLPATPWTPASSQPAASRQPVPAPSPTPAPQAAPAPRPAAKSGQPVDEWQEFARSLEALTQRKNQ